MKKKVRLNPTRTLSPGLPAMRTASLDPILCSEWHGQDRSYVPVLSGRLHWPVQQLYWEESAEPQPRNTNTEPEWLPHVRCVQVCIETKFSALVYLLLQPWLPSFKPQIIFKLVTLLTMYCSEFGVSQKSALDEIDCLKIVIVNCAPARNLLVPPL